MIPLDTIQIRINSGSTESAIVYLLRDFDILKALPVSVLSGDGSHVRLFFNSQINTHGEFVTNAISEESTIIKKALRQRTLVEEFITTGLACIAYQLNDTGFRLLRELNIEAYRAAIDEVTVSA